MECARLGPATPAAATPMKALFDTNILIDYLNGVDASKVELGRYRERMISIVTWMEVQAGGREDDELDVIEMFLRDFRIVEITRPVARETVEIRRAHRLRLPDALVWAALETFPAVGQCSFLTCHRPYAERRNSAPPDTSPLSEAFRSTTVRQLLKPT